MKASLHGELSPRAAARGGMVAVATFLGTLVNPAPCLAASALQAQDFAAGLPANLAASLGFLPGAPVPALNATGRPSLGALAARGPASFFQNQRLKFPGSLQAMPVPAALSLVLWVRLSADEAGRPLFGFGESGGDYFLASTDSGGAPTLSFLHAGNTIQFNRAPMGAANLADGKLHAIVVVFNLGSGLVRLYVDGKPETATASSLWRPREFGSAFAVYALQGRSDAPHSESRGLLMPRIIPRELSDEEIATLKPDEAGDDAGPIDPKLGESLVQDTLMEFWPPEFSHALRWRPL